MRTGRGWMAHELRDVVAVLAKPRQNRTTMYFRTAVGSRSTRRAFLVVSLVRWLGKRAAAENSGCNSKSGQAGLAGSLLAHDRVIQGWATSPSPLLPSCSVIKTAQQPSRPPLAFRRARPSPPGVLPRFAGHGSAWLVQGNSMQKGKSSCGQGPIPTPPAAE